MSPAEFQAPGSTERTKGRRIPENSVTETAALHQVLDAGLVAHLAVVDEAGQPYVLPVAYARRGEQVLFHGSTGSRLFRGLAAGQPTCLTVTLLDGLVLARSAFESSMNYRSAMVLGVATQLHGDDELDALACITEHLLPGRWLECRHPSAKERAATLTLALDLNECSVKIRTGAPDDDPADLLDPVFSQIWAGEVPLQSMFATPIADENTPTAINVPEYITKWRRP